jgi:hypothetical protein
MGHDPELAPRPALGVTEADDADDWPGRHPEGMGLRSEVLERHHLERQAADHPVAREQIDGLGDRRRPLDPDLRHRTR